MTNTEKYRQKILSLIADGKIKYVDEHTFETHTIKLKHAASIKILDEYKYDTGSDVCEAYFTPIEIYDAKKLVGTYHIGWKKYNNTVHDMLYSFKKAQD